MNVAPSQSVSVIGAARSGIAAARVLHQLGMRVTLSDSQSIEKLDAGLLAEIASQGIRFVPAASVAEALPGEADLVVTSPGVPQTAPVLQEAIRRGLPVWSEIELAYTIARAPIVATTGTNGKTTTTLLIQAMLTAGGFEAVAAGNVSADEIKKTLIEAAYESKSNSEKVILVAEISSFQLEWVAHFAPRVGILTNITPDHLNRHADFDAYATTKMRLFAAQAANDWAILNFDDPVVRAAGQAGVRAQRLWATLEPSSTTAGPIVRVCQGQVCVLRKPGESEVPLFPVDALPPSLPGRHNLMNSMMAGAAAWLMGAAPEAIESALRAFRGVAHRMEFVANIDGVPYVNNSMCTNTAAAIASLEAVSGPVVVILGGAEKGLDYAPLVPTLHKKARGTILIGAAADMLERTFRKGGYTALQRAGSLEEAVETARHLAVSGDTVLLSPACASFDMFRDFEARGVAFRNAVRAIKERTA